MDREQRNRAVAAGLIVLALLVGGWTSLMVLNASHYWTFHIDGNFSSGDFCKDYDAACTCYGSLRVMESYPPQYACAGVEICHDTDRLVCP